VKTNKQITKPLSYMNLNEDRKAPLREKDFSTKKEMVMRYMDTASKVGSFKSNKQISPQEFIYELKTGTADEKLISCLESLRVSLTSNPVSWVENFGHEGLGLLLDTLERLVETKHQDKILKKVQHKIIQCLKAFMNNKYGLERIMGEQRSFSLLAKTIDPRQVNMMTDVAKLLSAICIVGEENILEKILEALTTVAEEKNTDRFFPIVEGLRGNSVHLQIACMQLINALVTSPDDLDFRLHIRNEFMRCGLKEQLPQLKCINNDALDIQLRVFSEHKEEDMIEFSHRLGDIRSELEYPFKIQQKGLDYAEGSFLSILQHLLLIRNDHCIRPLYFKLIEECISQIVLHRSGIDPDFSYRKRLDVDFSHILGKYFNITALHKIEYSRVSLIQHKRAGRTLDKRLLTNGTSLESPTHLPQVDATPDLLAPFTGAVPPPPPPPPPPLPASFTNGSGKPPLGVPPPPPLPTLSGAQHSPTSRVLPFGLKPKKEFKPEVTMKRLNWSKVKKELNTVDCVCLLPPPPLAIFLGSFRVPYEQIKTMILEIDEVQLSESMVQNLINHLPEQKQLDELSKLKNEYNNLSDPEQFAIVMSNVKRLKPRLSAILFKLQFEEQVNNIKPDIMAVSAACEELKKSRSFSQLLELVLLMGNYMNAGSRNAQSFGFNLCSLCKLKDTKSVDQMTTLLHFLVEICEEKYPNILKFVADLQHLDKANRVSVESLEKSLKQMEGQLKQLERDLETFPLSEDIHDKFVTKMSISFFSKQQFQNLSKMHENMEKLYRNIMEYYALDLKKVSVEEFLTDLNNFRTMFMQATKDNMRRKEAEEKQSRARIAKEKAEKEKLERQENKKRLLEMQTEGDETGVMDSLLEALQSGAAFRDRRKRTTRTRYEMRRKLKKRNVLNEKY
uniref:Diaphanous related formin 3 n=1 Tax=Anolis carolinensis TaxID=28377 RepID=A0A803TS55_ANOCA